MERQAKIYPRLFTARIKEALSDTPALFFRGARQAGKSTLAAAFAAPTDILTLDDPSIRAAAMEDPLAFVTPPTTNGPLVIDEIQRVPDLLIAIKAAIDRDRRPGRFILTGSANVMNLPRVTESLAGRVELFTIYPLSRAEIGGYDSPLAALQNADFSFQRRAVDSREQIIAEARTGGFPEVLQRASGTRRTRWFQSYIEAAVTREVRDIAQIDDADALSRILRHIAVRSGGPRNVEAMAHDSGVAASTLRRYLSILETVYLVAAIPAWFTNNEKRITKQPKLLLVDSGFYNHILGEQTDAGPLLEVYVGCELQRLAAASEEIVRLFHYRTSRGMEVDWVLENSDGRITGIEVKAASAVNGKDFRGLYDLADAAKDRFRGGIVFYTGDRVIRFGERLYALPLVFL